MKLFVCMFPKFLRLLHGFVSHTESSCVSVHMKSEYTELQHPHVLTISNLASCLQSESELFIHLNSIHKEGKIQRKKTNQQLPTEAVLQWFISGSAEYVWI